ncbi:MAG: Rrf2 family transcriptional regulator [Actinobacteria bacterium]|nr:Rrf2 family transcriptional regulator [Actinomycetota bacterium]
MKISTKGRYALRLMIDIAQHEGEGLVSLKAVSARQDISAKYLEHIVPLMVNQGLLLSERGHQGGYRLKKPAGEITAGDVIRAAEGSFAPVSCLDSGVETCSRQESCPTVKFWAGLYDAVENYANGVTLADLIAP